MDFPVSPMLAKPGEPFDGDKSWYFEPKYDGERCIAFIGATASPEILVSCLSKKFPVALQSRRGTRKEDKYPEIVEGLSDQEHSMVLDGEIVALDAMGVPDFQILSLRSHLKHELSIRTRSQITPVFYYVFDILERDGHCLTSLPLVERKSILEKSLTLSEHVRPVTSMRGNGLAYLETMGELGMEGLMAKRVTSRYFQGKRSPDWLKLKFIQDAEFLLCGLTPGEGSREDTFGAMIIGAYNSDHILTYVGRVGSGFNQSMLKTVLKMAREKGLKREGDNHPGLGFYEYYGDLVSDFSKRSDEEYLLWVKPEIVVSIRFQSWTEDGRLRFPTFRGIREDIDPKTVTIS